MTEAFVSLANSLVGPFDVIELLSNLTLECAHLLDVASAGLLLADGSSVLHVVAASSEATRSLELFQVQREQGPCLECYRSGSAVSVADLDAETGRWPQFVPAALQRGLVSVHALPMRLDNRILGTLGLFGTATGVLNEDDLRLGQALAHVASVTLLAGNAATDRDALNGQLQIALQSRVAIEQAKGAIAQHANVDMDEAFVRLRTYSRDHNEKLAAVARAVVARSLPVQEVVDNRRIESPHRNRPSGR